MTQSRPTRRNFLERGPLALALMRAGLWGVAPEAKPDDFPVAETRSGKLRGMAFGPIICFRGIYYGASTSGKNRFMPPQPVTSWTGIKEAFAYGNICPQFPANASQDYTRMIEWDKQPGGMGEDCLNLNLWTPGLADGRKRPVFVSFHGGGFTAGSSNSPGYHGEPLARYADAAVVTVNHRLASFGFAHFGEILDERFAASGTVGMQDLVASLQWIHDNIANFGGDPDKVMIFGQSGGGRKVSAITAMPSGKGLFQRAAVQSGSISTLMTREAATRNAKILMQELGISGSQPAALQEVPYLKFLEAQGAAMKKTGGMGFIPVVDGKVIPQDPFEPAASEVSKDVPMIIGTMLGESALSMSNYNLDEAGLEEFARKRFGAEADKVLAAYRKAYPAASPYFLETRIDTQMDRRARALHQADRKSAQGGAPAWVYRFDYPSPGYGGKFGPVHGTDVSLVFHNSLTNIDSAPAPEMLAIMEQISSAWVAFAKTGDPNNPRMPQWPAYNQETRTTMLFDTTTRAVQDPDRELRLLHKDVKTI
ncbi:MAG TPA: carboxylesterase family protein [Bryobacteraceae bacterium]|nr:carboxylesterase family protein [Bryobacteraceae bacterium]